MYQCSSSNTIHLWYIDFSKFSITSWDDSSKNNDENKQTREQSWPQRPNKRRSVKWYLEQCQPRQSAASTLARLELKLQASSARCGLHRRRRMCSRTKKKKKTFKKERLICESALTIAVSGAHIHRYIYASYHVHWTWRLSTVHRLPKWPTIFNAKLPPLQLDKYKAPKEVGSQR